MKELTPRLENNRIVLRTIAENDAADIFAYGQDEAVAKYVFWDTHQSINDSLLFIKEIKKSQELVWAIELKETEKVIGTCGFIEYSVKNKSLKLGYALNQEYWNKGYMQEALATIIAYAFNNLDVIRIEGVCVVENTASAKTMLNCAMKFEGIMHDGFIKDNQIYDCKLFALTKRNYLKNIKK